MDPVRRSYVELHIAVLLFGLTAILGDLITLSALVLVWWRVLLSSASFVFIVNLKKTISALTARQIRNYIFVGFLVGLHWICFYGSIKYSNASIALVCMSTTAFFTSIVEPLFFRKKIQILEVGLGIIILPAMALIVNATELEMLPGIWVGLLAALLASIFATINKKLVNDADSMTISFLELSGALLFVSIVLPIFLSGDSTFTFWPTSADWIYLLILAFLCTTLAYVLALKSLKHLTAYASNLVINLEPVYGILLAIVILNEHKELSWKFYLGGGIIVATVLVYPFLRKRFVFD